MRVGLMAESEFQGYQSVVLFKPEPQNKVLKFIKPILYVIYKNILFKRTRPLFIFGCMRSGSTVLSHIIFSHPEIFGVGETHVVWRHKDAMYAGAVEAMRLRRELPGSKKYFLDKILHSHLTPDLNVLDQLEHAKFVVLLRKPAENITSLHKIKAISEAGGIELAVKEYCERLRDILKIIENREVLLIKYEDLTANPRTILKELQFFLDLETPFSDQYDVTRVTGRWGYGDGSSNIRRGTLLSEARKTIEIDPELLKLAQDAYSDVVRACERRAACVSAATTG